MRAVEQGATPEALEKLVALQERIMAKQAEMAFNRAFQEFQSQCPSVSKNRTAKIPGKNGGSWGYDFADLNHIASVVKPHLKNNGFSYTFDSEDAQKGLVVRCHLHHVEGHSRTAQVVLPPYQANQINNLQSEGVRMSYGRRYALLSVLGITTGDEDNDGHLPTDEPARKPQRAPVTRDELTGMWTFWKSQNERGTPENFREMLAEFSGIPADKTGDPKAWDRPTLEACQRNLGMVNEEAFSV